MTIDMEARSDIISEQKVGRAFFVKKNFTSLHSCIANNRPVMAWWR